MCLYFRLILANHFAMRIASLSFGCSPQSLDSYALMSAFLRATYNAAAGAAFGVQLRKSEEREER